MTPIEKLGHYLPNPDYGRGCARRRIVLEDQDGTLTCRLFDDFHEMVLELRHDGETILSVEGRMDRFPKTTCPGAVGSLSQVVGATISAGSSGLRRMVERTQHCTHLLDLALLGIAMLERGETRRVFEISVTDRDAERCQKVAVTVDGQPGLSLLLRDEVVEQPDACAGVSLFGGFGRWAAERFSGLERDLWTMAQMTVMIAQGRAFLTDGAEPLPVSKGLHRKGACYTFSEPQFSQAWDNIGTVRNLSDGLPPL
jgi:hypothetical protein